MANPDTNTTHSHYVMTLPEMHANIARMKKLQEQDTFTDDDYHNIRRLFELRWRVPCTDEQDTEETIHDGFGDGAMRNSKLYCGIVHELSKKLESIDKYEYYRWLTFTDRNPKPTSDTEIWHTEFRKFDQGPITCCVCKLTKFKDEYGETDGGGLASIFFRRTDTWDVKRPYPCI